MHPCMLELELELHLISVGNPPLVTRTRSGSDIPEYGRPWDLGHYTRTSHKRQASQYTPLGNINPMRNGRNEKRQKKGWSC
jgi:hypothetical protein